MPRRTALFGLAAGILAVVVACLWPRHRPHVLLITLDTTRADRLGCYGYAGARTPVLDSLAASGVLCEKAYTVAPLTLPAHASLFTGLYPVENGIRTNGRGQLDESIPTLAEVLRRQGYETAAFVASFVLNAKFGLDRGFTIYDDAFTSDEPAVDALHRQRQGTVVVDSALAWLSQQRSRPWFCWVHLYDPHGPYLAHNDLFGDEFSDRPYDGEIAYVDRQIGRLLEFLKSRGLDSQTLVVIVGDHGEGLGEHVERTHGSTLYNATMHVPLIFRHPPQLASGRRIATNVSMVDVSPTILHLLGLPDRRKITGTSIRPALMGRAVPASVCYGATDDPYLENGWSPLRSLIVEDWKYIRTTRVELYDLAADPHERQNLAESDPARMRQMEVRMAEFESRMVPQAEDRIQLSAAERRALASLGYAGGASETRGGPAPANLPDVKEMLPFDAAGEEAAELLAAGAVDAAIGRARELIWKAPTLTSAYITLAQALTRKSEFDEAAQVLRALLADKPESRDGHYGLGNVLVAQGRLDEAIAAFTKAVEIDPEFARAQYKLAAVLADRGRSHEALFHFRAALESDPQDAAAYRDRGKLLANLGRIGEAIDNWQDALKYDPDNPQTHYLLGTVLGDQGRIAEARQHLLRAVELSPADAGLHYALAAFLVRQREFEEAVAHLTTAVALRPGYAAAEQLLHDLSQTIEE